MKDVRQKSKNERLRRLVLAFDRLLVSVSAAERKYIFRKLIRLARERRLYHATGGV